MRGPTPKQLQILLAYAVVALALVGAQSYLTTGRMSHPNLFLATAVAYILLGVIATIVGGHTTEG